MLNPLVRWEPGQLVRYHGSLTNLHGVYRAYPCPCLNCGNLGDGAVRFQLLDEHGNVIASCVRARSITPEDNEPETECERGDCFGIHHHPDGYQDCDGRTI